MTPIDADMTKVEELVERLHHADQHSAQRTSGSQLFAEAADTISSLRARVEALEGAWQPIETAPKDGTWVQIWRPLMTNDWQTAAPLVFGRWYAWDEDEALWAWPDSTSTDLFSETGIKRANESIVNGDCFESLEFTHWRPLPLPPSLPTIAEEDHEA